MDLKGEKFFYSRLMNETSVEEFRRVPFAAQRHKLGAATRHLDKRHISHHVSSR